MPLWQIRLESIKIAILASQQKSSVIFKAKRNSYNTTTKQKAILWITAWGHSRVPTLKLILYRFKVIRLILFHIQILGKLGKKLKLIQI